MTGALTILAYLVVGVLCLAVAMRFDDSGRITQEPGFAMWIVALWPLILFFAILGGLSVLAVRIAKRIARV